jgi:hypothetical protein
MGVHVFSFEFVVTSGILSGQHGTEDYAYAFEPVGEATVDRRYRAFRVTNVGSDNTQPITLARNYAREFAARHGNVRVDAGSARSWPLAGPTGAVAS